MEEDSWVLHYDVQLEDNGSIIKRTRRDRKRDPQSSESHLLKKKTKTKKKSDVSHKTAGPGKDVKLPTDWEGFLSSVPQQA